MTIHCEFWIILIVLDPFFIIWCIPS